MPARSLVRPDKVAHFRALVQSGAYQIDAMAVAEAMLRSADRPTCVECRERVRAGHTLRCARCGDAHAVAGRGAS